ncbi:MAG TPA: DUF1572 family protein [Flavobacteriales bacterium]
MPVDLLTSARAEFQRYRQLGEDTFAQLTDEMLFRIPAPGSNSIAVIVKHMHGNMLSRWTDFLTTDGEKPWRERDAEFENDLNGRAELMDRWNAGWECLFTALAPLTPSDLERMVVIRREPHTVAQAIVRQLAHLPYHVGQIVVLGKLFTGEEFRSLSIPKGGTKAFNAAKGM